VRKRRWVKPALGGVRPVLPVRFPFLLQGFIPVCCAIKARPEDFVVEEDLGYEPCGEGPHLFLWIEKRGLSMEDMVTQIRTVTGASQASVGYAGLKDRRAVTRQWISLPAEYLDRVRDLDRPWLRVLEVRRHRLPLRTGQLRGNRFRILLRSASVKAVPRIREAMESLAQRGMANIYGPQRFGRDYEAARVGMDVVLGRMDVAGMSRLKRRFVVSAVQAHLFNCYCQARNERGGLSAVRAGDILRHAESGELVRSQRDGDRQDAVDSGVASVTGPVYGRGLLRATGLPGDLEQEVLNGSGLGFHSFDLFQSLGGGARRALVVRPRNVSVAPATDGVLLDFYLPSGAFATSLLREIIGRDVK